MPARRLTQLVREAAAEGARSAGHGAAGPSAASSGNGPEAAGEPREARYLLYADVVYNGLGTPRADAAVALFAEFGPAGVAAGAGGGGVEAAGALAAGADGERIEIVAFVDGRSAALQHPASLPIQAGLAISPPLVNAHTHLDLSDMPFTPGAYEAFIAAVVAHGRGGGRGLAAAKAGLAELRASGVEIVGDIVTDEAVAAHLLAQPDLRGVAYWEVFGPREEDADAAFERARDTVTRLRQRERAGGMRVGLSPHTPHTVSAPLLRRLTAWAAEQRLPLAIHVAETPAERELQLSGRGTLAESLGAWGFPVRASGLSPVAYLESLGVLAAAPTLVHMVAVDEHDVSLAQRHGCAVVHCPRSNDALGSGRFPWELYARHGVEVAFGTDSRGSSMDLDVSREVEFAARLHGAKANPRGLVRAAVKGGHRALGLEPPLVRRGQSAAALVAWGRSFTGVEQATSGG